MNPPSFLHVIIEPSKIGRSTPLALCIGDSTYGVENANGSIRATIRKRFAYPKTFCRQTDQASFELGYDEEPESLRIRITETGHLVIYRDAISTLPLFYAWHGGRLVVANTYGAVAAALDTVSLSEMDYMAHLVPGPRVLRSTVLRQVFRLNAEEVLEFNGTGIHIQNAPDRGWGSRDMLPQSNPRDFLPFFTEKLRNFVNTRLVGQQVAFQVSGGLDSATLPLFFAQRYASRAAPLMSGVIPPREVGIMHLAKMQTIARVTKCPLLVEYIDENNDFPFAQLMEKGDQPFYYDEGFITKPLERNARALQDRGVTVIATGYGADDICENILNLQARYGFGPGERTARTERYMASYLTKTFRHDYIMSTPSELPYAIPRAPLSTVAGMPVVNNCYAEHDIWPVSPFIDPELYEFVQGLPAHFRSNKNIFRAFHQAYNFPPEIYNAPKVEDFSDFFQAGIMKEPKIRQLVVDVLGRSVGVSMGYIDPDDLREAYDTRPDDPELALSIFRWLTVELSLQSVGLA